MNIRKTSEPAKASIPIISCTEFSRTYFFPCEYRQVGNVCKISAKETLHPMVVDARQSFQLFRQITWFLRNTGSLSKYKFQILISIVKL